ncbi:hypothetical protein [Nocardia sp. NPDC004604]|uniref:hypothetical protein n=1 Tax=Nocardia sp. NPDC004604 TaxID=3157013 RepID=UPI0033AD2AA1
MHTRHRPGDRPNDIEHFTGDGQMLPFDESGCRTDRFGNGRSAPGQFCQLLGGGRELLGHDGLATVSSGAAAGDPAVSVERGAGGESLRWWGIR